MAIDWEKLTWISEETPLSANNLNHIENGIQEVVDFINNTLPLEYALLEGDQFFSGINTFAEKIGIVSNLGNSTFITHYETDEGIDYLTTDSNISFRIPKLSSNIFMMGNESTFIFNGVMKTQDTTYGLILPNDISHYESNKIIATTDQLSIIPTIEITQEMITGYGGAGPFWYRFYINTDYSCLIDDKYDTIKLDITAIKYILGIPTDYIFIKRNVTNSQNNITLYQFFVADTQFDYSHLTDQSNPYVTISRIGDAAFIYDATSESAWLTNVNISPNQIWAGLATANPTLAGTEAPLISIEVGDVKYSVAQKLYKHHFDVNLNNTDLPLIPVGYVVNINVNALSASGTAWQTLSELDGGGFIVSAFGFMCLLSDPTQIDTAHVFELKVYYNALGKLLLNVHDLTDNTVKAIAIASVGGGLTPSTYAIQDSVVAIN